jgi:multidrug efflux pump subunit AcrB
VTAAVLLPAAAFGDVAGLEVLQPLAVTVLGGLVTLVAVQGYVLPALLASTERQDARQSAEQQTAEQQIPEQRTAGRQGAERAGRAQLGATPPLPGPAAD